MSNLLEFYRGTGTDSEGRRLAEIWAWGDDELEAVHDFIQWLFPLPEPSQFNSRAPLLTDTDIAAFLTDDRLRASLRTSFHRFLSFLGLKATPEDEVIEGDNFAARRSDVWDFPNHNWLRITRVLRSLTLLGLGSEAQGLYGWLEAPYRSRRFPIPANTFGFWSRAVRRTDSPM
jgi:hypothetical protein